MLVALRVPLIPSICSSWNCDQLRRGDAIHRAAGESESSGDGQRVGKGSGCAAWGAPVQRSKRCGSRAPIIKRARHLHVPSATIVEVGARVEKERATMRYD